MTRIFERLASFTRVVLWDKRGTGLSDPVDRVPTLDERVDDLMAVMDTVGSERAAFFGVSEGGPMSLLFAASHPERTTALVLYGASPKFSSSPDWEWGWSADEITERLDEIERGWGDGGLLSLFAPSQMDNEAVRHAWGRYQRTGASPAMGRAVYEALCEIDCREVLSAIRVPTLILHPTGDLVADVRAARYMAERIPGAQMVEFPSDDHVLVMLDPDAIVDEIEQFLTGSFAAPSRAIACACALRDAVHQFGIDVRVGLHTGECEIMGDDVGGLAVHTGARVAAHAGAGEVLVSSTVKDLVAGARIGFVDRGTHELKGVPGEWRLFAVTA